MKPTLTYFTCSLLALAAFVFSGCTTVEKEPATSMQSTTTETTSMRAPMPAATTTETQTVHRY